MKYFLRILAILLPMMLLYSCSDDSLGGEPDLPSDIYVGPYRNFTLGPEAEGLSAREVDVTFLSDSGEMFTRSATHSRSGDTSSFHLDTGLAEGGYRLIDVRLDGARNDGAAAIPGETRRPGRQVDLS